MIKIITIEREYGCGAGVIAQKIADRLGWKLWDQLLTCEIARLIDCDQEEVRCREEHVDPLYYRLFKSIMRGSFEGSANVHRLKLLDADSIFRITERVVREAASGGNCVIVGRGSQHFLSDRDDALHVFLFAPKKEKVRRLMAEGISQADAEASVDTVDQERAEFIERYFHMEWPNRWLYDAMLNTAMGDNAVIQTILNLKKALEQ
ncbi:MAG TPA: cytidylate kinase-like family protein [Terriglobales bacterium]|jgi:cytidylate kinase|nr:cytidylate kinase-like family protein [Terriglobales bacterium]